MVEPILNPEAIAALRAVSPDDGGAFFTELIDIFLQDTPLRIKELEDALATGNVPLATRAAHSIKGSAGNFGASGLAAVALEMETAAKAGQLAAVAARQSALAQQFALVRDALLPLRSA